MYFVADTEFELSEFAASGFEADTSKFQLAEKTREFQTQLLHYFSKSDHKSKLIIDGDVFDQHSCSMLRDTYTHCTFEICKYINTSIHKYIKIQIHKYQKYTCLHAFMVVHMSK